MGLGPTVWHLLPKGWALSKCKVFIWLNWLAIKNKCWTADRLARRGLSHPHNCVLCDQKDETVQHILTCEIKWQGAQAVNL